MKYRALISTLLFFENMSIAFSQVQYTLPPLGEADIIASTSSSRTPQGIFHYSDNDNNFQSNFKLPDFERLDPIRMASELLSAAATAESNRKTLSGINLPLPFAGKPLKLELTGESQSGLSLRSREGERKDSNKDLTPEARDAFAKAKQICLHSSAASCDEALDTLHRIKYGTSLMSPPPSRHLLDDDPTTSFAKLLVPSLEERLEALEKDVETTTTSSDSSIEQAEDDEADHNKSYEGERRHHPFDSIPHRMYRTRSTARKIQDFLHRIT
ncbi:unnamed protein product [Cylicocyclus nassatus]|uniref:Uncharacterized protein n=1 Tax=Cylicocyclus nassatus TaxID=53992 RepID=A0AA36GMP4_CYLNA|nr:unnamed protein product [Cylicocyclus nassatus]